MKENYYVVDGKQTSKYVMDYRPLVLYISHKYGIFKGEAWEYIDNAISHMLATLEKRKEERMSYLQLLILIDYNDMPKRVKCKDVIYYWNDEYRLYESEGDGMDLSRMLVEKHNDSELASDMSMIEGIEW